MAWETKATALPSPLIQGCALSAFPGFCSGVALTSGMLVVMKILSVAETLGGAALILGFLTRWAALGFTIIMLGALYIKIQVWGIGFAGAQGVGWEFDLILLAASIHLFLVGAGKTALDNLMSRNT